MKGKHTTIKAEAVKPCYTNTQEVHEFTHFCALSFHKFLLETGNTLTGLHFESRIEF